MEKVATIVETFLKSGEIDRQGIKSILEEGDISAEELIGRVEKALESIEGVGCPECDKLESDLKDALEFLKKGDYSEDDLEEVKDWLEEVEEMIEKSREGQED